jgi:tetratricopeptide (TPR) repeat protein
MIDHAFLVNQIKILNEREADPAFIFSLKVELYRNTDKSIMENADNLILQGRQLNENGKEKEALVCFEKSLNLVKTAPGYYYKGAILLFADEFFESFRALTSCILIAGNDEPIPHSYRFRAIALYELLHRSLPSTDQDEQIILNQIKKDLKKAIELGDPESSKILRELDN